MPAVVPHTSLAINLSQWRGEIGRYFGFGRTYSAMTASQQADVDAVIDRGMRQFYAPPILDDGSSHLWSLMRPTMNISVHASYSVGHLTTVTTPGSATTATFASTPPAAAPVLPTWVPNAALSYIHPVTDERCIIHIQSRTSNTVVALSDTVDGDVLSSGTVSYKISDGIYQLPTSFGGIEGNVTIEDGSSGHTLVRQVGEDQIREMLFAEPSRVGKPLCFAIRATRNPDIDTLSTYGVGGQYSRYEMVFFPEPDATYQMSFRYLYMFPGVADYVVLSTLTSVTQLYPPGMAYHHETMLASCLAVAEQFADSPNGENKEYFSKRIAASVAIDRKTAGSPFMGRNIDRSDTMGRNGNETRVTYENNTY